MKFWLSKIGQIEYYINFGQNLKKMIIFEKKDCLELEHCTGFFQKCQQYFRGNNPSQNYEVESDEHEDDDESFTAKLSNFGRSYQKVSTEDNSTKYVLI